LYNATNLSKMLA